MRPSGNSACGQMPGKRVGQKRPALFLCCPMTPLARFPGKGRVKNDLPFSYDLAFPEDLAVTGYGTCDCSSLRCKDELKDLPGHVNRCLQCRKSVTQIAYPFR